MPYIGKSPGKLGVRQRYYYTATGSETSKSGTDDNGISLKFEDGEYVDVYLNGSLLVAGSDYNTNTTNTISGLAALAANDILEVVVYDIFSLAKVNTEAQRTKYYKTASGGETSITGTDDSGATITFSAGAQIDVRLNGVSLKQGDDYNTTTANTVGGLTALTAGQLVEIVVYEKFVLADMVKKSGDTMTGALSAPSISTTGNITASGNTNVTGNVDVGGSLLVDTVKEGTGTNTAMTIDSNGYVSMPNTTELDIWNLPSDVTISSSTTQDITTLTRWAVDWEKIGTGMSHSSGVFTFPSTGKWRCTAKLYWQGSNGGFYFGIINRFSTDSGSTFTDRAYAYQNAATSEYADTTTVMYVDVTNVSTARAKFSIQTHASGTMGGNAAQLRTYVVFEKLAAT